MQTAYVKGRKGRLPSPVGLGNQGLVQQGQPGVRGIPKHTVTLSPRRMPDALVGILLQKKSTRINMAWNKNTVKHLQVAKIGKHYNNDEVNAPGIRSIQAMPVKPE